MVELCMAENNGSTISDSPIMWKKATVFNTTQTKKAKSWE